MGKQRRTSVLVGVLAWLVALQAAQARTLHVSPDGTPDAPGTREQPMSLQAAFDRVTADTSVTGITLAGGDYRGVFTVDAPAGADGAALPDLTIAAAEGQTPRLRHSVRVEQAEPWGDKPGVFRTRTLPPGAAQMWEVDTRVRYRTLATAASVVAHPGSCHVDTTDGWLTFSTSDSRSPADHEVRLCLMPAHARGLALRRPRTAVEGLHFADYTGEDNCAIQSYGSDHTIRRCHFENCERAWVPWTDSSGMLMEHCTGQDVAQPVISFGRGVVVRGCRFEKLRDRFLLEVYPQNDCGYQVYSPGSGGTFEDDFAKGYFNGILIKAGPGPYRIRHNTIVDAHSGVLFSAARPDSDVSHNVIVGARAFVHASRFPADFKLDRNLFWESREWGEFDLGMRTFRGANLGKFNMLADPRFVDAAKGDYRLLPDSPAIALADGAGRPAGAFAVGTLADARQALPVLELGFEADSAIFGVLGDRVFDRDPWIGGGTTHIRTLGEPGPIRRLTGTGGITMEMRGFDAVGSITAMSFGIDGAAPVEQPYANVHRLTLPDADGEYRVTARVRNDRGSWSEPAEAMVRVDRRAPTLAAPPAIIAGEHGIIVTFSTDEPCFATLQYGESADDLKQQIRTPERVQRFWDANDGGEWVERWRIPTREHALALVTPQVAPGGTVHCRLTLTDQGGLSSQSEVFTAVAAGEPRVISLGPDGRDEVGAERYRTLQYAVDRALPGDRVVLQPGVYTDFTCMTHGGVDDARRITIEAATPGTVTLDGAKQHTAMLHLEQAPWVTVRGLRMSYYRKAGVYAYKSPHTTIEQCVFFNGNGWVTGYHTFMFNSPHATVSRCLAVGAEVGFYFLASPHATVTFNTASQSMYGAASYVFSARGSRQIGNSFAFAGNDIYSLEVGHPDELRTFQSDYNNMGTLVSRYGDNAHLEKDDPELWRQLQKQEFAADYPSPFLTVSKALVAVNGKRYLSLRSWRDQTGQDRHSIMADPRYMNAVAPPDRWDWRVPTDSANAGAGPDGTCIGALGPNIP
jgi:hypothetical protein